MKSKIKTIFRDCKTGKKKDGSSYAMIKALDNENDAFFNLFGDISLSDKVQKLGIQRNDEIVLVLDIKFGYNRNYISLLDVEKS